MSVELAPPDRSPAGRDAVAAAPEVRGRASRPRPQDVVLVLVFLAPHDGLLLIVPHPSWLVAWKEVLVGLAVGLAVLGQARTRASVRWPLWVVPLIGLIAWASLSALTAPGLQSLWGLKVMFTFPALGAALVLAPFDGIDRDRLVSLLMVNGAVTALVGLGQQLIGAEVLNRFGYEYNEVIRFSGGFLRSFSTFNQPFPFAFFLMVSLLVGVAVGLEDRRRRRNQAFLAVAPVLVVAMVFTFVRASLLGVGVGLALLAARRHRVLLHSLVPLPLIAAVVLVAGLGAALLSPSSLIERVDGWTEQVVERSVEVEGEGIGSTGSVAELFASDALSLDRPDSYQPDNYYVKVLVELGPIGAWLFAWVVIGAYVSTHRAASHEQAEPGLAHGVAAATAAALVAALVASYWEIFPADLLFWVLVGVSSSLVRPSS